MKRMIADSKRGVDNSPFVLGFRAGIAQADDGAYDDLGNNVANDVYDWGFALGQVWRRFRQALGL